MSAAAVVVAEPGSVVTYGSPSQRAEVLAFVSQSAAACVESVTVYVAGEELYRGPLDSDNERTRDRLLAVILEDTQERESGTRHTYTLTGWRGDRDVTRCTVRVAGAARTGGGALLHIDPTTQGTLKLALRHLEGTTSLLVRSHGVIIESLSEQVRASHERARTLEEQCDQLRRELREAREGGRLEAAQLEAERERMRVYRHLGEQLLRYLPHVLARWFPMPDAAPAKKGAKGAPAPAAPPEVVKAVASVASALAGVTDAQLDTVRGALSPVQLATIQRARSGETLTPADLSCFTDLDDAGAARVLDVLRPDQLEALAAALPIVALAGK